MNTNASLTSIGGQPSASAPGSLLLFQVGPVQDFIAQARSTRDLRSGSYLLSWLMAHAIKSVADAAGDDALIFPLIANQPLIHFLRHREKHSGYLVPNLPNRFCALVPGLRNGISPDAANIARAAAHVFDATKADGEWAVICATCLDFLQQQQPALGKDEVLRWQFQIAHFWQVTWQLWPLQNGQNLQEAFAQIPNGRPPASPLSPEGWNENYQLASHRLDARRQLRDFIPWEVITREDDVVGWNKDHFSGREERVIDKNWVKSVHLQKDEERALRFLFRKGDELGAINTIKRVWHKAYLKEKQGLERANEAFDSVPAVAAAPWRKKLVNLLQQGGPENTHVFDGFDAFARSVDAASDLLQFHYRRYSDTQDALKWIERTDAGVFHESEWNNWMRDAEDDGESALANEGEQVKKSLRSVCELRGVGEPGKYFAILKFDGDEMGKWLSGAKTGGAVTRQLHREFSRQLSNFALNQVGNIVQRHNGELIYSGGDDVLALLPATEALDCAQALRDAFHGIQINGGHLKASAGVAIAHMRTPLQNAIEAARLLEKRAKKKTASGGYGRDAIAIALFKRSGEQIVWGAGWEDKAVELARAFKTLSESPPPDPATGRKPKAVLSSRFPYALAGLFEAARRGFKSGDPWRYVPTESKLWFEREFDHVCSQQTSMERLQDNPALQHDFAAFRNATTQYWNRCEQRRLEDLLGPFLTTAFIHRESESP